MVWKRGGEGYERTGCLLDWAQGKNAKEKRPPCNDNTARLSPKRSHLKKSHRGVGETHTVARGQRGKHPGRDQAANSGGEQPHSTTSAPARAAENHRDAGLALLRGPGEIIFAEGDA